jgi:hypothetical protein
LRHWLCFLALPTSASAASHPLGKGKASFSLDPFFALLVTASYPFYAVAPATTKFGIATTPSLSMPVTGGVWNKAHSRGTFLLKGGLDYIHYTSGPLTLHQLSATAWHAQVNMATGWTAFANGSRIVVLDEDLTGSHTSYPTIGGQKFVKVSNIVLTYDAAFNTAFNTVFGVPIGPSPFGTATLLARLK